MSDRLQELLRQKALLSEHTAWLEREIAIEQARSAPAPAVPATPKADEPAQPAVEPAPRAPSPGPAAAGPTPATDAADAAASQFQRKPADVRQEVTRGCLIYFVAAFVLLGLGVAAIFWLYSHR